LYDEVRRDPAVATRGAVGRRRFRGTVIREAGPRGASRLPDRIRRDTVALRWIHESGPRWDANKARIVGGAPKGVFSFSQRDGDLVPGEWWRVEDEGGSVLGYGWMEVTWADAEVLLAVDGDARKRGVGSFIVDRLHEEARARGLNYMMNAVPPTHPQPAQLREWLEKRGFEPHGEGELLRSSVRTHKSSA
jgi:GNAT superfamily N-acetyltransferase